MGNRKGNRTCSIGKKKRKLSGGAGREAGREETGTTWPWDMGTDEKKA